MRPSDGAFLSRADWPGDEAQLGANARRSTATKVCALPQIVPFSALRLR